MKFFTAKKILETLIGLIVVAFFISVTFLAIRHHFNVPYVESENFESWVKQNSPIIIDLREGTEAAARPLQYKPVIHLPFLSIENKLDQIQIPRNHKVLLVCSDGNRARLVASILWEKGIHTYYLKSGLDFVQSSTIIVSNIKTGTMR